MPEVAPFAAIRFNDSHTRADLSSVLAPPYDVLDAADKDALLAKSARNIVAIDLPHIPPKAAGPQEAYQRSARLLDQWLSDGTLIREPEPALYLYHQRFEHAGKAYTRRMFIARVRLQPFLEGSILPHEQTFGGPKEDRLALMKATRCQLSPIFGLYADPKDVIDSAFARIVSKKPDATGTLDGVENRMWIATDSGVIDTVVSAMADKKIYIADGHHRYGTALMYRDYLASEPGGPLSYSHPANYVMFVLASMDDPGCLILPYHRVLSGIDLATLLDAWSEGVMIVSTDDPTGGAGHPPHPPLDEGGREGGPDLDKGGRRGAADLTHPPLDKGGPGGVADLILYDGRTGSETPLRFTNRDILATLEPDECEAWHKLDYAYLHRYLIDELLSKSSIGAPTDPQSTIRNPQSTIRNPVVRYAKSANDAKRTARKESGVALLTNATPMAHLRAVSESGGLMPQKSTYFHPKLPTGLTINPLT